MERFFQIREQGSTIRTEVLAGFTTFLTMVYIVFLQPAILSVDLAGRPTGLDAGAVLVATCLASCFASIAMGLYANYPLALAPGMGENFLFVTVISQLAALGMPDAWRVALGIVFLSGIIFWILSVLPVRQALIDSVSPSLRAGIAAGIGLFIAFLGLRNGGILAAKPGSWIGLSPQLGSMDCLVFLVGLVVAAVLQCRQKRGAILFGILASAVLAVAAGRLQLNGFFGFPEVQHNTWLALDVRRAVSWVALPYLIIFVFMDLFDSIGTLIAVADQAGLVRNGTLPRSGRVLVVDSGATVVGSLFGTSTVVSYVESAAGVAVGGRTGLTSLITGMLFLVPLALGPFVHSVGSYLPITAPALVIVGALMMQSIRHIAWDDFSEALPAFITLAGIPLTFSIADGLALGFVSYPMIKLLSGRRRDVRWPMVITSLFLLLYFVFVRPRIG